MTARPPHPRPTRLIPWLWTVIAAVLLALGAILRASAYLVLRLFQPIVEWVLAFACGALLLVCALYYLAGPPGLHVPFGKLLMLALLCGAAARGYGILTDALHRE